MAPQKNPGTLRDDNFIFHVLRPRIFLLLLVAVLAYSLFCAFLTRTKRFDRVFFGAAAVLFRQPQEALRLHLHFAHLVVGNTLRGEYFEVLVASLEWFAVFMYQILCTALSASIIVPRVRSYPFDTFDGALEALHEVTLRVLETGLRAIHSLLANTVLTHRAFANARNVGV